MVSYTLEDLERIRNSYNDRDSMTAIELIQKISHLESRLLN